MNRRSPKSWLFPVVVGLAMVAAPATLCAAPFQSDFTNAAWTVNDGMTVTLTPTTATIGENQSTSFPSIDLSQVFSIPAGATTLSFSIVGLGTDGVQDNTLPPFFAADLLDTSANSLVSAIAGSTDFYARDLTDPTFSEAAGAGTSVTPANSSVPPTITVTLDISSIPANTTADLVFSVFPNGDGESTFASIKISDVTINGGTIVRTIPEPGSIVLLSMGILGVAGHMWRKRAK